MERYSATRNSFLKIQNSKVGYDYVLGFINVLTLMRSAIQLNQN